MASCYAVKGYTNSGIFTRYDVYNIGLAMLQLSQKEYIVQLNVPHSMQKRYVHLNNLLCAFQNDPDLVSLPQTHVGTIMQAVLISTGCDYVSYFKSLGKSTILNIFC